MYALVYFKDSQTTDVLKESDLDNKEGEEGVVIATYGKDRFEGVILKENKNPGPLQKIAVSKEGVILKPKDPERLSEKVKAMKSNRSSATKTRKKALQELSANLLDRQSIFTNKTDNLRNRPESSEEESIETQASGEASNEEDYPEENSESEEESEKETSVIERSVSEAKSSIKSDKKDLVIDKAIYDLKGVLKNLESVREKDKSKCVAMIKKNLPGFKRKEGSIEVQPNLKLYISELDEADVLRFKDRPKEMIRRSFKYLVGPENLIKMVPIRNASKIGIPEKIRKAVFWYVNKNASTKIDYATFMETVSSQCITLRNPNKKTPKKEKMAIKLPRKATPAKSKRVEGARASYTASSAPADSEKNGQVSPNTSLLNLSDYPDELGLDEISNEITMKKVAAPSEIKNNHSYETEKIQSFIGVKSTGEVVTNEKRVYLDEAQSDSGQRKKPTSPPLNNYHQRSNTRSRSQSLLKKDSQKQKKTAYPKKTSPSYKRSKSRSRTRRSRSRSKSRRSPSRSRFRRSRSRSRSRRSRSRSRSRRSSMRSRSRRMRSRSRSWRSRSRSRSRRSRSRSRSRRSRSRRSMRSRY